VAEALADVPVVEIATESSSDTEALWERYASTGSPSVKDQLVMRYSWLVRHVLSRLAVSLPPSLDYGDLAGYGYIALVESIDRFERERGFKFETYAAVRVRGAVLDAIRSMDLVSRPVRRRMRQIGEAVNDLSRELQRLPTDGEVADRLGLSVAELRDAYQHGAMAVVSLDSVAGNEQGDDGLALHESVQDGETTDPLEEALRTERIEAVASALASLSERDRVLLSLYYYEGLNMREIGEVLGISESRVCQLHTKAIVYLRGLLSRNDRMVSSASGLSGRLAIPA